MSADRLRKAAALMRTDAHDAICPCGGPACTIELGWFSRDELRSRLGAHDDRSIPRALEHISSWSPAVALAVADLLDLAATHQVGFTPQPRKYMLDVADAYLAGES